MTAGWEIVQVESKMDTMVFVAELDGQVYGAAELNPAREDLERPATLEMI